MDENYLDNLLNEVALDKEIDNKIEEELDSQIHNEKMEYQQQQVLSDLDLFNMDLEQDAKDAQSEQDLHFSQDQMEELDQLDDLADLEMGDLDFADIDFDDLDITKLDNVESDDLEDLLKNFESDLEIDNIFAADDENKVEQVTQNIQVDEIKDDDVYAELSAILEKEENIQMADLNEDAFDAERFLDGFLNETESDKDVALSELPELKEEPRKEESLENILIEGDKAESHGEKSDLLSELDAFDNTDKSDDKEREIDVTKSIESSETVKDVAGKQDESLEDLLSMLEMSETSDQSKSGNDLSIDIIDKVEDDFDEKSELVKSEEVHKEKTTSKQKIMTLLFGEPDEDDVLSEEELAEIEAKKAAKKEKKKAVKKARKEKEKSVKEEKANKKAYKQKKVQERKSVKAQKKAKAKAEALAVQEPEKKLNKFAVIFIFTFFLGGTFLFVMATNNFNYTLVIERATQYFTAQKYRKAFDEIVGVEVKDQDEDLKNRIYTVMYVERLYEAYLSNIELQRYEKALDSLLRGVAKYYEHYAEAEKLGVTADMDYSFNQIKTVLNEQYGITVEEAVDVNKLTNYEYVQYIQSIVDENNNAEALQQNIDSSEDKTGRKNDSDAVVLLEE